MSGLLYLKNHYSIILIFRFHLPEKYMGPYHFTVYLVGSYHQLTESENLCPESHGMPLHSSAKAQTVGKNDGFQSARLSKIWTVVSLAIMTWHLKSLLSIIKKQNQFYGS